MNSIFTIELLPARHGDAIWIEYGDSQAPHRILIDGGAQNSTSDIIAGLISDRIEPTSKHDFELVVLTHIDADHITGLLRLFDDDSVSLRPRDVWFNGWDQLPDDLLGAKQAERLSAAIERRDLPWNSDFDGKAVRLPGTLQKPDLDHLPVIELPGGMLITLLSPTYASLAALKPEWKAEVEKAGLVPGRPPKPPDRDDLLGADPMRLKPADLATERFEADDSVANAASIAFLAEFDGRSALLTGDASDDVLRAGIGALLRSRDQDILEVGAFKLPHHGSKYNLSLDLLRLVKTRRYLFSTDGSSRSRHPNPVAVARIVTSCPGASLEFNYSSAANQPWNDDSLMSAFGYDVVFPGPGERWLTVRL